jgi:predicted dehydrogenase
MNLTPEEKAVGRQNFAEAIGSTRRDFLLGSLGAVAAAGTMGALGGYYFKYEQPSEPLRVGIIGVGDEGGVLIGALNPDYINVVAIADIRPYSIHRAWHGDRYSTGAYAARPGLMKVYGWNTEDQARELVNVFGPYQDLVDQAADLQLEGVIIALPLHLHEAAAIYAMKAGLNVLTEKLMAHSVRQCKEMARVAQSTGKILATGHQRHYSILYDNAIDQIRTGLIGDIHHIRAQWHRGNLPGSDSWSPPLPCPYMSPEEYAAEIRAHRVIGDEDAFKEAHQLLGELHSWQSLLDGTHLRSKELVTSTNRDEWKAKIAQKRAQLEDIVLKDTAVNYSYQEKTLPGGYVCTPLEELIRWRLWDRTGGGLMAELGSHQLDAASLFISAQHGEGKKVHPLTVSGVGVRNVFPADRDTDDHVYCHFEFPGVGYFKNSDTKEIGDPNKKIVVSYSSINGNGFGGYGEIVCGTKGTLVLEREQEAMLFQGANTATKIEVRETVKGPVMDTYETGGGAGVGLAGLPSDISRGYREEIEHWAWCIKNPAPENKPRCTPDVALADAVIALTSNIAIRDQRRIEFEPAWFEIDSDEVPG